MKKNNKFIKYLEKFFFIRIFNISLIMSSFLIFIFTYKNNISPSIGNTLTYTAIILWSLSLVLSITFIFILKNKEKKLFEDAKLYKRILIFFYLQFSAIFLSLLSSILMYVMNIYNLKIALLIVFCVYFLITFIFSVISSVEYTIANTQLQLKKESFTNIINSENSKLER